MDATVFATKCHYPTRGLVTLLSSDIEGGRAAREIEEPALKKLIVRIRNHEVYHTEVCGDLLEKEYKDQRKREKQ